MRALASFAARWQRRYAPRLLRRRFLAMGTQLCITVWTARPPAEAEAALAAERAEIERFGEAWWAWGRGALAAINRKLEQGGTADIPQDMRPLFARAWAIHLQTGGRYEPRIGALVRLWGFDDIARLRSRPPAAPDIDQLRERLRQAPPYIDDARYGPAPGVCWDFGGIAKGHVVDQTLARLAARGFPDATVDAGGNLAVRGARAGAAWRIGIREPGSDPEAPRLIGVLDARDEAVNTHGDDQRGFECEGLRYAHLLDPLSGWPAQGLRSLTVVHPDGCVAEAVGAALFVSGPAQWPALAARWGITQVLAVAATGEVQATPALAARLRAEPGVAITPVSPH